ncbi:MAG: crossover junction endodeoxyribonuclease RuvC [Isosphaeraceae bacterium]|jgi:crossover junction endodeoxyribonuclease RuvC|nr:MAG: crossover junction endodeoxyribonuclease RuvC [Isosphaeraceae bacterium]
MECGRGEQARVLGIDPGLNLTGYAVVEPDGRTVRVIEAGVIRTQRGRQGLAERLETLHRGLLEILDEFKPAALALEQVHAQLKRPRTAVLMAHARGVIVLAAQQRGVAVHGYAAARIKKTLTGSGRAGKDQVQRAVQRELGLDRPPEPHDVADACAVAISHLAIARNWSAVHGL